MTGITKRYNEEMKADQEDKEDFIERVKTTDYKTLVERYEKEVDKELSRLQGVTPVEARASFAEEGKKQGKGIKKGRGIRSVTTKVLDPISRWSQIGKLKYNNRLLDEKQMFSIKYPSGAVNPHFPKAVPVSDLFHELLTNLENTKKVDKRILSDLDKDEKKLFEHFIVRSGAGRQFGIMDVTPTDEEKEREERYIIVKGTYLAGNNAQEVINELRSHILYFIDKGRISKSEGLATLRAIV